MNAPQRGALVSGLLLLALVSLYVPWQHAALKSKYPANVVSLEEARFQEIALTWSSSDYDWLWNSRDDRRLDLPRLAASWMAVGAITISLVATLGKGPPQKNIYS